MVITAQIYLIEFLPKLVLRFALLTLLSVPNFSLIEVYVCVMTYLHFCLYFYWPNSSNIGMGNLLLANYFPDQFF